MEYDPLLSKLIAYGPTRERAIARMLRALGEYYVAGIKTNLSLFRRVLADDAFRRGNFSTAFLDSLLATPKEAAVNGDAGLAAIAAAMFTAVQPVKSNGAISGNGTAEPRPESPGTWKRTARQESLRAK
jgi:acetyl-CoA carboxylase biotin carboxylase subunit